MTRFAWVAFGLSALSGTTLAAEAAKAPTPASSTIRSAAPGAMGSSTTGQAAGLRAYVDPRTGQLRPPSPEEQAREAAQPLRSDRSKVWIETLPDGSKVMHTERQLMMPVVATADSKGEVTVQCDPQDGPEANAAEPKE